MSLARGGRALGLRALAAAAAAGGSGSGGAATAAAAQQWRAPSAALRAQLGAQARAMGGGGGGEAVTYGGLTLRKAPAWEYAASKAVGGFMWFWVFYMLYNHWDHKVHGLAAVFEKEGLDDDDHDHGHH